jgi:hypothetical protein
MLGSMGVFGKFLLCFCKPDRCFYQNRIKALSALVAYDRFAKKLPALYSMMDATLLITDTKPAVDKTELNDDRKNRKPPLAKAGAYVVVQNPYLMNHAMAYNMYICAG